VENHKPWRNAPLQEAIFEIRFPPIDDYALFAGGMAISQQEGFPKTYKLHADIPEMIQLAGVVKHRFISKDESLLFQTGSDVLSVNFIKYKGFSNFLGSIKQILVASEKFIQLSKITRLDLRYINSFPDITNPTSALNINLPFSDFNDSETQALHIQEVSKVDESGRLLGIGVQYTIETKNLILDLDISLNSPQDSWNIDKVLEWADRSHDIIWDRFQSLVSDKEKEVRT
jgi:uncharacterized protein (TIGR04255 family)